MPLLMNTRESSIKVLLPTITMSIFQKEKAAALLELLRSAHAEQYSGLDDEMPDDCEEWISNLTDDEISEICVVVYHKGI